MTQHVKDIIPGGDILYLSETDSDNIIPISVKDIVCVGWFSTYEDSDKKDFFIMYYNGRCTEWYHYYYYDRVFKRKTEPLMEWIANRGEFFFYVGDNVPTYWNSGFSYFKGVRSYVINVTTKEDRTQIIGQIGGFVWESFELAKNRYYERLLALIKLRKKEE